MGMYIVQLQHFHNCKAAVSSECGNVTDFSTKKIKANMNGN